MAKKKYIGERYATKEAFEALFSQIEASNLPKNSKADAIELIKNSSTHAVVGMFLDFDASSLGIEMDIDKDLSISSENLDFFI